MNADEKYKKNNVLHAGGVRDGGGALRCSGDFVHLEHSTGRSLAWYSLLSRTRLEKARRCESEPQLKLSAQRNET